LRGAIAALLPLFVAWLTIMTTFLGLRLFNEATSLSIFALNLANGLGLRLAIDYSLFVLSRYREETQRDGPARGTLPRTLRTAWRTVVFRSLTSPPSAGATARSPFRAASGIACRTPSCAGPCSTRSPPPPC
jgi:uncharacterized membrane protein YdfJ with MMPL/SSD domain